MSETQWTRPSGRPPTDAEEFVLNLAREGNEAAQSHVYGSPYLRDQARWACAIEALNAIGRVRRPDETIGEAGERLARQALSRSFCWGLRDGEWWLVEHINGEPQTAYHQLYGRVDATRGSFERWTAGAYKPAPVVVGPASTPANVAVSMCAQLLLEEHSPDNGAELSDYGRAYRDGVNALAEALTTPDDAPAETINERRIAELETLVRNLEGRCATVAARASVREKATLEAEDLHRQQVAGANRREARLRSQLEAWRDRAETRESEALELRARAEAAEALREVDSSAVYVGRDVLEAAHELRQLGCEGEDAHAVMVDAARVLSESRLTIESIRAELRETNTLRRDSHSRLQAVRDAVRED